VIGEVFGFFGFAVAIPWITGVMPVREAMHPSR
jgi:hypothetical protein